MIKEMIKKIKFFTLKLVFLLIISLIGVGATYRPGLSVFKGKLENVGATWGNPHRFLKYTKNVSVPRGFTLALCGDVNDATSFTFEMTKSSCQTGEPLMQDFFGSPGEYYFANIRTSNNKFLIYDEDKKCLQTVSNMPKPQLYAWMVFHCLDVDEYIFYPLFDKSLVLQKLKYPDDVDVLPLYGEKTTGRDFIYWKLNKIK